MLNKDVREHVNNMHPIVQNVLVDRGLDICGLREFLIPTASDIEKDDIPNTQIAVKKLYEAIKMKKQISIYFDVDVDGVTSGTIIYRYLKTLGLSPHIIINKGKDHSINPENVSEDTEFLIVVDALPNGFKALEEMNIPIIILDHHTITEYYESDNITLVSSNNGYFNPALSGAGVVFKFCLSLEDYIYKKEGYHNKEVMKYADLASCGIVADVSDMTSMENRLICKYGYKDVRNPLLKHLLQEKEMNSKFVIWTLAPLINSLNRDNKNEIAVQLMIEDDVKVIKELLRLAEQSKIKQNIIVEEHMIEHKKYFDTKRDFIFIVIDEKYQNYSGLIASKILGIYNKLTMVVAVNDETNTLKGSMRCRGLNGMEKIRNCFLHKTDYCLGHVEAAGISISLERWDEFLYNLSKQDLKGKPFVKYDCDLSFSLIDRKLVKDICFVNKITGKNFEPIKFKIPSIMMDDVKILKDKHTKFVYSDIDFLYWNNTDLFEEFQNNKNIMLDVVGELSLNKFAGQTSIQFIIDDITLIDSLDFSLH